MKSNSWILKKCLIPASVLAQLFYPYLLNGQENEEIYNQDPLCLQNMISGRNLGQSPALNHKST